MKKTALFGTNLINKRIQGYASKKIWESRIDIHNDVSISVTDKKYSVQIKKIKSVVLYQSVNILIYYIYINIIMN